MDKRPKIFKSHLTLNSPGYCNITPMTGCDGLAILQHQLRQSLAVERQTKDWIRRSRALHHKNNWESPIPVAAELGKDLVLEFVSDSDLGSPVMQHAVHIEVPSIQRIPAPKMTQHSGFPPVCLHVPNVAAGDFGMGIASHCRMHVRLQWYDNVFAEETEPSSQEPHRCYRGCRGGMSKQSSERLSKQSKISESVRNGCPRAGEGEIRVAVRAVKDFRICEKRASQSKDVLTSTKQERERTTAANFLRHDVLPEGPSWKETQSPSNWVTIMIINNDIHIGDGPHMASCCNVTRRWRIAAGQFGLGQGHVHEAAVILAGQHETDLKGQETVLKKQRIATAKDEG
ncbi:hypothetical protein B0H14DRAFT_2579491 [Mycena olivaceomarginata]|nr:hypothetical protein B0H14DRAFT_2579491 [Mycena olivaceomarginata]